MSVRPRTTHQRRVTAGVLLAALVPLCAAAPGAAAQEAAEEAACPVVAAAQGVQVMVSKSDDLFLSAPSGAALPAAQACVDYGVRESSGYAGAPYPGETVTSAPGILRGQTDQPVPDYPAYAASRHPSNDRSSVSERGYTLDARSRETASEASARTVLGQGTAATVATAKSAVSPEDKSSQANATSDTQPLVINDVLRLGEVHSSATAAMRSDGTLTRKSRLQVGRTTVGGQEVVITPDGVRAAGQQAGLPGPGPVEALETAGVRVRYLEEAKTRRGVLGAGIEVLARQKNPETGEVFTVHYTFGRAFAAAAKVDDSPGAGSPGTAIPPGDAGGEAVPKPAGAEARQDGSADSGPAAMDEAAAEAAGPDEAPAPAVAAPAQLTASPADMGLTGLYLVLVFGALAMFAGGTLLRLLGVKTRWTS